MKSANLKEVEGQEFDVLIVGGGITGAWAAYDAALRGLKVCLVEKGDWSSGTSQSSSKLIHGGLRYLERFDFKLVKSALHERKRLVDLAPHRVWPLRFTVPIYKQSRVGKFKFKIGLMLYDLLAGKGQPVAPHKAHDADAFPLLNPEDITKVFSYGDGQTDDFRFTLEIIDGAVTAGAVCANYSKALSFIEEEGEVCGAVVQQGDEQVVIRAKRIVMATSIWSGLLPGMEKAEKLIRMSKGIHVVLPKLPMEEAMLLMSPKDGRVFFVIPWYERTLLGTTDTDYHGSPDEVKVEAEDIQYLLDSVKPFLQEVEWTAEDVIGSFCGLRMLERKTEDHPSAASREWSMKFYKNEKVIMPLGGKYTTAREDASLIVDKVLELEGVEVKPSPTLHSPFPWAAEDWLDFKNEKLAECFDLGLNEMTAGHLIQRYGTEVEKVLGYIRRDADNATLLDEALPFIRAELFMAIEHEGARYVEDVTRRRVPVDLLSGQAAEIREYVKTIV